MLQAVIFDLDGVLCSTDEYHFRAWSRLACELHLPFDREKNRRLRGIGRMDALDILLEDSGVAYTAEQKSVLARRKNDYYVGQLHRLTPADVFPGVTETLQALRERSVKIAVGSSSKNAKIVLDRLQLTPFFDAVADGTDGVRSKPMPDVFLCAARKLGVTPALCAVLEDAAAGIEAAKRAGMFAVAYGPDAAAHPMADAAVTEHRQIVDLIETWGDLPEGKESQRDEAAACAARRP
ncbi:beta-phosphoglucomutase [uncultured Pyramidobacter sp.]|uniref:beta-phosphoglucomutase n=1 Tax=uncultured Pyramidobacter sp. TaxID=1623495 RepID=UPI002586A5A3|nr:beta-phosphoglucomutase [uncultured Pyramidobacter sp.]